MDTFKMKTTLYALSLCAAFSAQAQLQPVDQISIASPLSVINDYQLVGDNRHFLVAGDLKISLFVTDESSISLKKEFSPLDLLSNSESANLKKIRVTDDGSIVAFYDTKIVTLSLSELATTPVITLLNETNIADIDTHLTTYHIRDIDIKGSQIALLLADGAVRKLNIEADNTISLVSRFYSEDYESNYKPLTIAIDDSGHVLLGNNADHCSGKEISYGVGYCFPTDNPAISKLTFNGSSATLSHLSGSARTNQDDTVIGEITVKHNKVFAYDIGKGEVIIFNQTDDNVTLSERFQLIQGSSYWKNRLQHGRLDIKETMTVSNDLSYIGISAIGHGAHLFKKTNESLTGTLDYEYQGLADSELTSGQPGYKINGGVISPLLMSDDGQLIIKQQFNYRENSDSGPNQIGKLSYYSGPHIYESEMSNYDLRNIVAIEDNQFLLDFSEDNGNNLFQPNHHQRLQATNSELSFVDTPKSIGDFKLASIRSNLLIYFEHDEDFNSTFIKVADVKNNQFKILCQSESFGSSLPVQAVVNQSATQALIIQDNNSALQYHINKDDQCIGLALPVSLPNEISALNLRGIQPLGDNYVVSEGNQIHLLKVNNEQFELIDTLQLDEAIYGPTASSQDNSVVVLNNSGTGNFLFVTEQENKLNLTSRSIDLSEYIQNETIPSFQMNYNSTANLLTLSTGFSYPELVVHLVNDNQQEIVSFANGKLIQGINNGYLVHSPLDVNAGHSHNDVNLAKYQLKPKALSNDVIEYTEGETFEVDLNNYFIDPNQDTMVFSSDYLPAGIIIENNILKGTISEHETTVNITATDSDGLSLKHPLNIRLMRSPESIDTGVSNFADGEQIELDLTQFFAVRDWETLSFTSGNLPVGLAIESNKLIGSLPTAMYTIDITATNQYALTASSQVTFTVNSAPEFLGNANIQTQEGETLNIALASYFTDSEFDELSFAVTDLPSGLSLDGSNVTGTLSSGSYAFNVIATDKFGLTKSGDFAVTVAEKPPSPEPVKAKKSGSSSLSYLLGLIALVMMRRKI